MPRARTCGRNIGTSALAVEYVAPGCQPAARLARRAAGGPRRGRGPGRQPVALEAAAPDRTVVRWQDHGIPRAREYPVTPFGQLEPFPETPAAWTEHLGRPADALAEAAATCTDDIDPVRPGLHPAPGHACTRSSPPTAASSSSRSGFGFPWDGDLLISRSPLFACKAFARDRPVRIGKTDTHVVLRVGPWTIWHEIQKEARFPGVEDAIPAPEAVATRLRLDPEDAGSSATALDRLPGAEELNAPATLDLNGRVAVRARGAEQSASPSWSWPAPATPARRSASTPTARFLGRAVAARVRRDRDRRTRSRPSSAATSTGSTPGSRWASTRPSSRLTTSPASNRTPNASSRTSSRPTTSPRGDP